MAADSGLFSLFWVNMAFIVLLFTVCCVRVRALGRKGQEQQEQEHQQEQQLDDERRTEDEHDDDDDDHAEIGGRGQGLVSQSVVVDYDGTSLTQSSGAAAVAATMPPVHGVDVDADADAALLRTACWASQLNELLRQYTKRLDESDVVTAALTRRTSGGGGGGGTRSPVPPPPEASSEAIDDDNDGAEHHHTRSMVRVPAPGAIRLTEKDRVVGANVVDKDEAMKTATTPLPPQSVIVAGSSSSTPATTMTMAEHHHHEHHDDQRSVSDVCAICLLSMTVGEDVTWASNPNCVHVFHHSCILGWLEASCTKERERRLRDRDRSRGRRRRPRRRIMSDGDLSPLRGIGSSRSRDPDPSRRSSGVGVEGEEEQDQDQVEGGRTNITDHGTRLSSTSATVQDDPAPGTTSSMIEADAGSLLLPCPCCRQAFMMGVEIDDISGPPRPGPASRAAIHDDVGGAAAAQVVALRGHAAGAASATNTARSRPPLLWNPFPALVTLPDATGRRR